MHAAVSDIWQVWGRVKATAAELAVDDDGLGAQLVDDISTLDGLLSDHRRDVTTLSKNYQEDTSRTSTVVSDLQEQGMQLRMLPVSTIFNTFPRAVRDLAKQFRKDVDLIIEGGDTELDKKVLEEINDPLIHIMRNAVDHGIETPTVRAQGRQAADRHDPPGGAPGGRPHRHRDLGRRGGHRPGPRQGRGGPQGLHHRGRGGVDVGPRGHLPDLRVGLLDRGDHHRDIGSRRGHGRRAPVRRREAQGLARRGVARSARARRSA